MKKLILILFNICLSLNLYSQDKLLGILPMKNGNVTYSGIVEVDSLNKNEIYNRVKKWFVNTYKSANDVIQLDDKEKGELIGKGFISVNWKFNFVNTTEINIQHTIDIEIKDGKYRYQINGLRATYYATGYGKVDYPFETWYTDHPENCRKNYPLVDLEFRNLIASLEKSSKQNENIDW